MKSRVLKQLVVVTALSAFAAGSALADIRKSEALSRSADFPA